MVGGQSLRKSQLTACPLEAIRTLRNNFLIVSGHRFSDAVQTVEKAASAPEIPNTFFERTRECPYGPAIKNTGFCGGGWLPLIGDRALAGAGMLRR